MLGPRHLPTSIQVHHHEQDFQKHQRKLDEITKDSRKKNTVDKEETEKSRLFDIRAKGLKFHNTEKANQIERDNELLLGKLVEISRKKKPTLFTVKTEGTLPKTLHGPSRRREKDRIAAENEAFARRLLSQQPSFNRKKLEVDYEKHNERVKQMQKLIGFSPRKVKLPPLSKDEFDVKDKKNKKAEKIIEDERKERLAEEEERKEKEELAKKEQKEKEEREAKEKEEQERKEKEAKEKQEKEAKEKEEKEKKEKEEKEKKEKEAKEKEEKEKKEKEAKEKAEKEKKEQEEKAAKEQKEKEEKAAQDQKAKSQVGDQANVEDQRWNKLEDKVDDNKTVQDQQAALMLGMVRGNAVKK